jgi:hypothetical protein
MPKLAYADFTRSFTFIIKHNSPEPIVVTPAIFLTLRRGEARFLCRIS